mmetsp:Transcript_75751/g.153401  ORF Transcript_75751/g.153401 Transcript_75751/m.153401 type:complete len:176 (-) Transcript_75751:174-701(-)
MPKAAPCRRRRRVPLTSSEAKVLTSILCVSLIMQTNEASQRLANATGSAWHHEERIYQSGGEQGGTIPDLIELLAEDLLRMRSMSTSTSTAKPTTRTGSDLALLSLRGVAPCGPPLPGSTPENVQVDLLLLSEVRLRIQQQYATSATMMMSQCRRLIPLQDQHLRGLLFEAKRAR